MILWQCLSLSGIAVTSGGSGAILAGKRLRSGGMVDKLAHVAWSFNEWFFTMIPRGLRLGSLRGVLTTTAECQKASAAARRVHLLHCL